MIGPPGPAYGDTISGTNLAGGIAAALLKRERTTFNITSIPTLMIIRDNIVLFAQPGALPANALEELITKAEALDMDEVRASMAQAPQAPSGPSGHGLKTRTYLDAWARAARILAASAGLPVSLENGP